MKKYKVLSNFNAGRELSGKKDAILELDESVAAPLVAKSLLVEVEPKEVLIPVQAPAEEPTEPAMEAPADEADADKKSRGRNKGRG